MLRRTFLASLVAAAAGVGLADVASAQYRPGPGHGPGARPGTWTLLGTQKVGFVVDRDVVRVGREEGRFRALKMRVLRNTIELLDVKIVFGNGDVQDLPVRAIIRANSETRPLDLAGNTRVIKEIQFTYKSKPSFKGQAIVEVYGQH